MNDRPSTKARKVTYAVMRKLFTFLHQLDIYSPYHHDDSDDFAIDFKGWKEYTNRQTPVGKRGGPAFPTKRKKSKRADRNATIR